MKRGPISIAINYAPQNFVFIAGVPVATGTKINPKGRIFVYKIPAGRALKYVYIGTYDKMESAYKEIMKYIKDKNLQQNGYPYEQYISDPANTTPDKLETHIFFPIK
jgi:effector-binding domain-containing protein